MTIVTLKAMQEAFAEIEKLNAHLAACRLRHSEAMLLIFEAGIVQGGHHKAWYVDQIARILAGDDYPKLASNDDWDKGIAP